MLDVSGIELGQHHCQFPVPDEVQPDPNSCPAVFTVVWIVVMKKENSRVPGAQAPFDYKRSTIMMKTEWSSQVVRSKKSVVGALFTDAHTLTS